VNNCAARISALALGFAIASVAHAEPPQIAKQEIDYLLAYIADSGCEFQRNGAWSDAKTAEAHVRGKYDFLTRLGQIDTAEDFIEKAATRSSLSDQPYEVRCGNDQPMPSNFWLTSELARYRSTQGWSHGKGSNTGK
jgi:hypothetical protein